MLLRISKFFLYISVFSVAIVMTTTFFPFIGGKDYLKMYPNGNILEHVNKEGSETDDYVFELNGKFSRFTATAGIDDSSEQGNQSFSGSWSGDVVLKDYNGNCTITFIADGNVIDTKNLEYGKSVVNIDENLNGYNKLIIRVKGQARYDILGSQFYFKSN